MSTPPEALLDPWYVTGLADGESTFTYSRSGRQIALYFAIKLTHVDKPVLEAVQEFLGGIGTIYMAKGSFESGIRSKTASYFRVTRRAELLRVVEHFDHYPLRTQKAHTYSIWRTMVMLKQRFRKPDRDLLNVLADKLSASCVRNQPWR